MNEDAIRKILEKQLNFLGNLADGELKQTATGSYHTGVLSGNRLNSGTLRYQFNVCNEGEWNDSDGKTELLADQRVFVQIDDDVWDVYEGGKTEPILRKQVGFENVLKKQMIQLIPGMSKELLVREKDAKTFLKKAMNLTITKDPNLTRLANLNQYNIDGNALLIKGYKIGYKEGAGAKKRDVYDEVIWEFNSNQYVLWVNIEPDEMEKSFFPIYNHAYQGMFTIQKEKNNKEKSFSYALYWVDMFNNQQNLFLTALRTKPFMLLAGISGTGKSRIVRKLAQASVKEELQQQYDPKSVSGGFNRWELHKPANFELIQVKPNWHNSLEVVGYKSNIGGAHYEFTPFVEFVARAWKHQDVPFFLCLDEMNLAPVEQYFAEFLSAIESRSIENGEYETDSVIKPFVEFGDEVCDKMINHLLGEVAASKVVPDSIESKLVERFKTKGLTLPKNLLVMGTVNMDETTFSFSRKVLDRAMSVVMNEVEYDKFFNGESENDVEEMDDNTRELLINRPIRGLNAKNNEAEEVKKYLTSINEKLNDTPFKLGYRAANEALLYMSAARHFNSDADIRTALDEFTMMKILSRIEGDKRSIGNLLEDLKKVITTDYPKSNEKLGKMAETLKNKQFVSYWT